MPGLLRPISLFAICAVALLLAGVACRGGGGGDAPSPPQEVDIAAIGERSSEFQRGLLKDGELTFAEYEQSVLATIKCLEERLGVEVEGPTLDKRGVFLLFTHSFPDDERAEARFQAALECQTEYLLDVEGVWSILNQPTEKELQDFRETLIACLDEADVLISRDPTGAEFVSLAQAGNRDFNDCLNAVQDQFGLPGLLPS